MGKIDLGIDKIRAVLAGEPVYTRTNVLSRIEKDPLLFGYLRSWGARRLLETLTEETELRRIEFAFPSYKLTRYTWGELPIMPVVLSLKQDSYFTHRTAMYLNGLIDSPPDVIHLNFEQAQKFTPDDDLVQDNIDRAFSNAPRISHNVASLGNISVCLLNGRYTGRVGVVEIEGPDKHKLRATDIERTLIDITVRPMYAGGVLEVLKAYKTASGRVSVARLSEIFDKLGYIYPYHQAIGFYLERSGAYGKAEVGIFEKYEKKVRFYLEYLMKKPLYSEGWSLFYPRSLD